MDNSRLSIEAQRLIKNWPEAINALAANLSKRLDDAALFGSKNVFHAEMSFDSHLTPETLALIFGDNPTLRTIDMIVFTDPTTGAEIVFAKV